MSKRTRGARYLAPFFISTLLASTATHAGVPVVDLGAERQVVPASPSTTQTAVYAENSASNRQDSFGVLFTQLQTLQQEVAELRGLVEQQQNELQQLKQEQKDNYLDTDRRLSELQKAQLTQAAPAPAYVPSATGSALTEKDSYDQAYGLLDKNRKDEAALAFRKHILLYPQGELTPNAYYWLGQIYLSLGQLAEAEEQLQTLLKQFPQHHKTMDAKFALGKVYFQQGNKVAAKKLIQEVAQSDSAAASVAKKYLQDNF